MSLYRYHIRPVSAFGTPLRSDTLYGHLFWAQAQLGGSKSVSALIDAFDGENPPFRLSSAFPSGFLPVPILLPIKRDRFRSSYSDADGGLFAALQDYKTFRSRKYVSCDAWQKHAGRLGTETLYNHFRKYPDAFTGEVGGQAFQPHNTIDRSGGSVLKEGGLHFSSATYYSPETMLDLYVETDDPSLFENLLKSVEKAGFGANSSTGCGQFTWQQDSAFDDSSLQCDGNARVNLSVMSCDDLSGIKGYYAPMVKHGRTWSGFGEGNPFKKPFLAFTEGSLFTEMPRSGFVLRNIHSDPDIVQVTWPLTIPVMLEGFHGI